MFIWRAIANYMGSFIPKYEEYLLHKIENTRLAFENTFIIYLSYLNLAIDCTKVGIAT